MGMVAPTDPEGPDKKHKHTDCQQQEPSAVQGGACQGEKPTGQQQGHAVEQVLDILKQNKYIVMVLHRVCFLVRECPLPSGSWRTGGMIRVFASWAHGKKTGASREKLGVSQVVYLRRMEKLRSFSKGHASIENPLTQPQPKGTGFGRPRRDYVGPAALGGVPQ